VRSTLADALAAVVDLLRDMGIESYLFGAQAAILHGSPRTTADIDLTVELGDVPLPELVAQAKSRGFKIRVPDPVAFAERTRVLPVLHAETGIPVDLVLAASPLESECQRGNLDLARVRQLLTMLDQALDRSDLLTAFDTLEAAVPIA
jgi:hypothetical protein